MKGKWVLKGYDSFEGGADAWYPLLGQEFDSQAEAAVAARKQLMELEKTQPSSSPGGQEGIQDQIWVFGPNGEQFRVFPHDDRTPK